MSEYYEFMDDQINTILNATVGFDNLLSAELYTFDPDTLKGFFDRYSLIREFQETTLSLFNASLDNEFDPELASLVINELPGHQGWEYHKNLTSRQHQIPVFFRTDEVTPGKIAEIQCPGSAWGLYEQLYHFYSEYSSDFGAKTSFPQSLSQNFSSDLRQYLKKDPVIHHLLDNASIPHGMRFFIQKTREHHLKYYSYDKGVRPYDCNFVRAHDFVSLFMENFAKQRLSECDDKLLHYDLPPSTLFEEKISLTLPFWEKTERYYSDEIRGIFPYTSLITPEGFSLEDGKKISMEEFCRLSQKRRGYYIKYAGSDISLNWGSKGVYFAGSLSGVKCREILNDIVKGYSTKKYWIIQKGYLADDKAQFITRNNEMMDTKTHSKFSGFYGPNGLSGILVMQRLFHKVHGTKDTVVSICK